MQIYIVPWCIARFCLSFPKELSLESVQEMLIAIIDAEQLMPGYPDCAAEAKNCSVAFKDFALRVKAAAGMYLVFFCLYFRCAYRWSDSVPPPLQYGPRAGNVVLLRSLLLRTMGNQLMNQWCWTPSRRRRLLPPSRRWRMGTPRPPGNSQRAAARLPRHSE